MNASVLKLIRMAMLGGMLMICGVFGYLVEYENFSLEFEVPVPAVMNGLFLMASLVALTVIVMTRNKREEATRLKNEGFLVFRGWVVAEGVAFLGAVIYLITSSGLLFLAGFLVLVMAFLLLPVPESMDQAL